MRHRKNYNLFLTVVAMGVSINKTCDLMGIHPNTVFQMASRNNSFRSQLDEALARQEDCRQADLLHFVHPRTLQPILDGNFEKIKRRPPNGLLPWIREQSVRSPLNNLAA